MGVFWSLSLKAHNEDDAQRIKAYAQELNNKYKFEEAEENGYGGLAFLDRGFCYGDVDSDRVQSFEEFIDKVVAHFPDMKLHFFGSGDGACQQWEKVSSNGVLVAIEPWLMYIHCERGHFQKLASHIGYITQQGFEPLQNEEECSLHWEYDRISQEEKCNSLLRHISKQMPQVEIVCYNHEWKDNVPAISEYCTMKDGIGEWTECDKMKWSLAEECVFGILEGKATIFDVVKDAVACFALALEEARRDHSRYADIGYLIGKADDAISLMQHFKPEDKQWLMHDDDSHSAILDAVLLWGMHNSIQVWEEKIVAEDTQEEIVVTRTNICNTPLFEMSADEEKALFDRLCNETYGWFWRNMQKNIIGFLEHTGLDYTQVLNKMLDAREFSISHGGIDDEIKWMCEKLGDIYRWGRECIGCFIDKQKAKKYYDIAQITDANPLDDEKQYPEYEDTPTSFRYTIKGDVTELRTVIEKHATEPLDNEFGIYAPVHKIMHQLVGTDPRQPEYTGNVLYLSEEDGNLVVRGEANDADVLAYAILKKYPSLEVRF